LQEELSEAMMPPIWAEIDLQALAHNCQEIRKIIAPEVAIMAVVKADGYGHGALQTAKTVLENGASQLGVARAHEGITLRQAGIKVPVLVFGYTSPRDTASLIEYDLTQTLYDLQMASDFSQRALFLHKRLKVQIKIDTGMGRLGLMAASYTDTGNTEINPSCLQAVQEIYSLPGLTINGIYTHFARADFADKSHARKQLQSFLKLLDCLQTLGCHIPLRHAANSAALIDLPEAHLDMVRAGIALYGLYPSRHVDHSKVALRPAMTLKTRIAQLKEVP
jgi:alanine racemase